MDRGEQEREVDRNFEIFIDTIGTLLPEHEFEHVLMRKGEMVSFHASAGAALAAGRAAFADGIFSVQEVTNRPIDLGIYSHAVDPRIA